MTAYFLFSFLKTRFFSLFLKPRFLFCEDIMLNQEKRRKGAQGLTAVILWILQLIILWFMKERICLSGIISYLFSVIISLLISFLVHKILSNKKMNYLKMSRFLDQEILLLISSVINNFIQFIVVSSFFLQDYISFILSLVFFF